MLSKVFCNSSDLLQLRDPSFDSYFKFTKFGMMLSGIHPSQRGTYIYIYTIIVKVSLAFFIGITLFTIYEDLYGSRDKWDAVRQISMMFMLLVAYQKCAAAVRHRPELAAIFRTIDEDFRRCSERSQHARGLLASYARTSMRVQSLWSLCVMGVLLAFPIVSVSAMVNSWFDENGFSRAMMCEFYVPFIDDKKYESPYFEIIYVYTAFTGICSCAIYLGYDCFNIAALIHLCCKLDILSHELRTLFPTDGSYDEGATSKKLRRIIKEHQQCYSLGEDTQTLTSVVHSILFVLNSMEITVTGCQVLQGFTNNHLPVDFVVFFFSTYLHLFLPCYVCEQINMKSVEVSVAAYESGWHRAPDRGHLRLRTRLMILIRRAQKPILINTSFGPVNLQMFTTVIRTSYSYFTLVNST